MFKFSLQALHQVRKRREEERQKELAEVMKALKEEEATLDRFKHDVSDKLHEQLEMNKTGYDNNLSLLYDQFQAGKKLDIQKKTELIGRINEVVVKKRQNVLKAHKDRKLIDNFKQRKYEEYLVDEKKAEEKEVGELVTMGYKKLREKAQWCTVFLLCFSVMTFPACGGMKQVAQVDEMNQEYEATKRKGNNNEVTAEQFRDTLRKQDLQNQQALIEKENLKETMIEMERMQDNPEVRQVVIEVNDPLTREVVMQTKDVYEPKVLYKLGYDAIQAQKFTEAQKFFNDFLKTYPQHFLADNCLYWLGESYYGKQDYKTALHYFQKIEQVYPKGNKVPDGLLKTAYSYHFLGRKNLALKAIKEFMDRFPQSSLRPEADKMLEKIQGLK